MPRVDLQRLRPGLAGTRQGSASRTCQASGQDMNAQRSVWSPQPPTVRQKYATYFGGIIDDPRYTEQPLIRLWWTDEEMKRLEYRELSVPTGFLDILRNLGKQLWYGGFVRPPRLASVTHDNLILFLDVLDLRDGPGVLYLVCDEERVLRYGFVPLPLTPRGIDLDIRITLDGGSWTWDGRYVWPLFSKQLRLFTCQIDTERDAAGQLTQLFSGYERRVGDIGDPVIEREYYWCNDARWVATDPQATHAIVANIIYIYRYRQLDEFLEGYIGYDDYIVESKYLPSGASLLLISRFGIPMPGRDPRLYLLGTFPVGPAWAVRFAPDDYTLWEDEEGFLRIFVGNRVAVNIPILSLIYFAYHKTTSTGLPYELRAPHPFFDSVYSVVLLRRYDNTASVLFDYTRFVDVERKDYIGDRVDVLVEFDLASGMAVKDLVVPTIYPDWGMEHNGTVLAKPMMTSSKGRLKLP
jgi:hypothetical protein